MTTMQWDPAQYLTYGDHRLRPFVELMNRVLAESPANIVDLGCGPGNATVLLTERWPEASVVGVDNSEEMIADAKPREIPGRLRFAPGDAYSVTSAGPLDVLISNATLQWVPGHLQEFPRYIEMLAPDGWFAFQVPGMRLSPSHSLIYDLAGSARWVDQLGPFIRQNEIESTEQYIETLTSLGCDVDAWETTYFQLLEGDVHRGAEHGGDADEVERDAVHGRVAERDYRVCRVSGTGRRTGVGGQLVIQVGQDRVAGGAGLAVQAC